MGRAKKVEVTTEQIRELYEPDYFYNYGENPALKEFLVRAQTNVESSTGALPDYRAHIHLDAGRWFYTRDLNDVFERNLKVTTFPRYCAALLISAGLYMRMFEWV